MALVNVLTACDDKVYWLIEAISKCIEKHHVLGLSDDAENFVCLILLTVVSVS
jgi:hypothetical protein